MLRPKKFLSGEKKVIWSSLGLIDFDLQSPFTSALQPVWKNKVGIKSNVHLNSRIQTCKSRFASARHHNHPIAHSVSKTLIVPDYIYEIFHVCQWFQTTLMVVLINIIQPNPPYHSLALSHCCTSIAAENAFGVVFVFWCFYQTQVSLVRSLCPDVPPSVREVV